MKNTLIIFLMIISIQTFGQKHEIGIDLFTPYHEYYKLTTPQNWITLRMNYKNHQENITNRYTFELGINGGVGLVVFDTLFDIGNNEYYANYTRKMSKVGIAYGLEKKYSVGKLDFIYGADISLKLYRIISGPNWNPWDGRNLGGFVEYPNDKKTVDFEFGLIPFAGLRYPITKRLFINFELGMELNYIVEDRPYYNGNIWEDAGTDYSYFPSVDNFFINNIGLSYRF